MAGEIASSEKFPTDESGAAAVELQVPKLLSQQSGSAFGYIGLDRLDARETEFLAELLLASGHRRIEGIECDGDHVEAAD